MDSSEAKKSNKKILLLVGVILIMTLMFLYFQMKNKSEDEKKYQSKVFELQQNLRLLENQLRSIKKEKTIVSFEKDSLKRNLNYLWVYKPLVMTNYLRDRITANFDFKPGDLVRMKTDSSIVLVTDVVLGGNKYSCFLKFIIKNRKGEIKEVSPLEIELLKNH